MYYDFARFSHKWVLSDFELNKGGDGGLPCPIEPVEPCTNMKYRMYKTAIGRARVAASSNACVGLIRKIIVALLHSWFRISRKSEETAFSSYKFGFNDGIKVSGLLLSSDYSKKLALPKWSLLHHAVVVPEQLQNQYARTILAGEFICHSLERRPERIFAFAGGARKDCLDIHGNQNLNDELLEEGKFVISSICFDPTEKPTRSFKFFVTSSLLGRECLADDRRLWLVGSELTYLLSVSISRRIYARLQEGPKIDNHLLRKFSSLAEFAILSRSVFGGQQNWVDATSFDVSDLCVSRRRNSFDLLKEFGVLRDLIICHITELEPTEGINLGINSQSYARMVALMSDILQTDI